MGVVVIVVVVVVMVVVGISAYDKSSDGQHLLLKSHLLVCYPTRQSAIAQAAHTRSLRRLVGRGGRNGRVRRNSHCFRSTLCGSRQRRSIDRYRLAKRLSWASIPMSLAVRGPVYRGLGLSSLVSGFFFFRGR